MLFLSPIRLLQVPVWQLPWTHLNNVYASFCDVVQNSNFVLCGFIVMKIFYDSIWISTTKKFRKTRHFETTYAEGRGPDQSPPGKFGPGQVWSPGQQGTWVICRSEWPPHLEPWIRPIRHPAHPATSGSNPGKNRQFQSLRECPAIFFSLHFSFSYTSWLAFQCVSGRFLPAEVFQHGEIVGRYWRTWNFKEGPGRQPRDLAIWGNHHQSPLDLEKHKELRR